MLLHQPVLIIGVGHAAVVSAAAADAQGPHESSEGAEHPEKLGNRRQPEPRGQLAGAVGDRNQQAHEGVRNHHRGVVPVTREGALRQGRSLGLECSSITRGLGVHRCVGCPREPRNQQAPRHDVGNKGTAHEPLAVHANASPLTTSSDHQGDTRNHTHEHPQVEANAFMAFLNLHAGQALGGVVSRCCGQASACVHGLLESHLQLQILKILLQSPPRLVSLGSRRELVHAVGATHVHEVQAVHGAAAECVDLSLDVRGRRLGLGLRLA
mmetsp:Transcript_39198/g.94207  ORF Transcript_39198/g.94207 Transcript_39198/m.94207 type:complete len:268 (-) Transcript_39198:226-1029(-)